MMSQDVGIINNLKIEDLYRKQVLMDDNWSYYVDVLDMAGQEEYTALRKQDIRDGEGSIIVYSQTPL
jgi:GTPase KRas protein